MFRLPFFHQFFVRSSSFNKSSQSSVHCLTTDPCVNGYAADVSTPEDHGKHNCTEVCHYDSRMPFLFYCSCFTGRFMNTTTDTCEGTTSRPAPSWGSFFPSLGESYVLSLQFMVIVIVIPRRSCADLDECAANHNCGDFCADGLNPPGDYTCGCNPGRHLPSPLARTCVPDRGTKRIFYDVNDFCLT